MKYTLRDKETNNGVFAEANYISDLMPELIKMLKDDMETEGIVLDEAVDYYEVVENFGLDMERRYAVDCEYNPDMVLIMSGCDIIWNELIKEVS